MDKAPEAFRTISEVADEIDVPQHVLRFWESRFTQIRPMKRGGGRRFYRPEDVDLLRGVRYLLYGEGYTIRGVQRILREQGVAFVQDVWRAGAQPPPPQSDEDRVEDDGGDARDADGAEERSGEEPASVRREPTFASPGAAKPKAAGLGSEARGQLRTTLGELVECRRLLEAVLADKGSADAAANGG